MSETAVRVENVSKLYRIGARIDPRSLRETLTDTLLFRRSSRDEEERKLWALRDVSFEVQRGEAVGIIGQNGAGKSTMLKILSRITEPTRGRIEIRGRLSSLLEVGTGFHSELTGRENILLNGAILGMTRVEIRQRFDEIVAFAEIDRFIDTPVKYYSTGMYMRLAFAVAAHLEPEILVVDEVLAVGDAAFQSKCLRKMGDVAAHGRTVLFVSHNMPAVKALCQKAVWLKKGAVEKIGSASAMVDEYLQHSTSREGATEVAELIRSFPPDPVFRLHDIVLKQRGDAVSSVLNGEPLDIEVTFDALADTFGLHVYILLYDLEEMMIFESVHNGDSAEPPFVKAGHYVATATIPANFLAPRPYQLRFNAGIANVRGCIPEAVRINFDVQQTGIVNRAFPGYVTPGRLAPHLPWKVARS
jgi:lipopolysaccharide transport system ATP-binding protein